MREQVILQLALANGIGDAAIKKILKAMEYDSIGWSSVLNNEFLVGRLNLPLDIVNSIYEQKSRSMEILSGLSNQHIEILLINDARYPKRLLHSFKEKSPAILYVQGNISLLNQKTVGFCGSRKSSLKGLSITHNCAQQLAENNIVIVSGYAAGVDLAAHKSALKNGGNTIFVLPEGILRKSIKNEIKHYLSDSNHVFVSQFMPEITWNSINAMKRNEVIIGISDAMILVESGLSGGTFAAGERTLTVNHPLFVIDFAKPEVSAEANPYFISKGGIPIRGREGVPRLNKVFDIVNNRIFHSDPEQMSLDINLPSKKEV